MSRSFLFVYMLGGVFFAGQALAASEDDVMAKVAAKPAVQKLLSVEQGWQVEHRCNLLPPADREQFWVNKMKMGEALSGTLSADEMEALMKMAEQGGSEVVYPCDNPQTRSFIDATAAMGEAFRKSR